MDLASLERRKRTRVDGACFKEGVIKFKLDPYF